jgi:hypothetical protein
MVAHLKLSALHMARLHEAATCGLPPEAVFA